MDRQHATQQPRTEAEEARRVVSEEMIASGQHCGRNVASDAPQRPKPAARTYTNPPMQRYLLIDDQPATIVLPQERNPLVNAAVNINVPLHIPGLGDDHDDVQRGRHQIQRRARYTTPERNLMVRYLVQTDKIEVGTGIVIWQAMKRTNIIPRHSAESLRNKFRRNILINIESYDFLPPDIMERFKQLREHMYRASSCANASDATNA